jgi:hypothetical protein
MPNCSAHRRRLPPPVRSATDALYAFAVATDGGRDPCVVVACLDHDRRPLTLFVVDGADVGPATLGRALDILFEATRDGSPLEALVLGLCRPGGSVEPGPEDLDAWSGFAARCREAGITLLDWFILADGASLSLAGRVGWVPAW